MSYNNRSDNFSVTSSHDGSRSIRGGKNFHFTHGSDSRGQPRGRSRGGGRGNRRPNYRNVSSNSRYGNRYMRGNEDDEGDISMSGDSRGRNNGRSFRSRGGRRGRAGRQSANSGGYRSTFNRATTLWHRVMVPFGAMISQNDLYSMIRANMEENFDPVQYSTDERRAYFYVKGNASASSLKALSRRITKSDGHKLIFHVTPSDAPKDDFLTEALVEKLKVRMSDRYDPATQLINLSCFGSDEVLNFEGIRIYMNKAEVMTEVAKIISEHIPELSGVDLSNNKLYNLQAMEKLVRAAPNVTSLNLGRNQIANFDELKKLKSWSQLAELVLDGNSLCNNFINQDSYVSAVRKLFPKVMRLDGKELPPPITFDLDTEIALPETKGSYLVNDDIKNLVVTFIKEFYSIYDTDHRRDLMPAYHENALLSVCVCPNPMFEKQMRLSYYFDGSRNLKKMEHYTSEKLSKLVHTGSLRVVAHLESMRATKHDINSFKVDVGVATPTFLNFVLHGVFKEDDGRTENLIRTFTRSFVTVPSGTGMLIINDMLTISNAGYKQRKEAFSAEQPTSVTTVAATPDQSASGPMPFLTSEEIQKLEQFVTDSGMNRKFSLKCLQENGWDYQKAGQVFTELHAMGKIPGEAFVKDS